MIHSRLSFTVVDPTYHALCATACKACRNHRPATMWSLGYSVRAVVANGAVLVWRGKIEFDLTFSIPFTNPVTDTNVKNFKHVMGSVL